MMNFAEKKRRMSLFIVMFAEVKIIANL